MKEKVYDLISKVPAGKITTYKEIGCALKTKGYRAIGQILKKNPSAPFIPCHRVVSSTGSLGGYMGKNLQKKINLLRKEGIMTEKGKIKEFEKRMFKF